MLASRVLRAFALWSRSCSRRFALASEDSALQPFEDLILADLKECFDGFECNWPVHSRCVYRGQDFDLAPGPFTARAVIGLSVSDQPAAAMATEQQQARYTHVRHLNLHDTSQPLNLAKAKENRHV